MRALAVALKAALTEKLQAGSTPPGVGLADGRPVALDFDEAQHLESDNALPRIYVNVTLARRFGGTARLPSARTVAGWRYTTTAVGTTVDEARWADERISLLENSRLVVAGYDCSPITYEGGSDAPAPDGEFYFGVMAWIFTTTPTS